MVETPLVDRPRVVEAGLFVPKPTRDAGCQGRHACLAWEATSVDVRWRPLLPVVIVTHLDTRSRASRWYERLL